MKVHPHACGEHGHERWDGGHAGRFIPTRVGNMRAGPLPRQTFAVHPHACGEHDREVNARTFQKRFIPTRVGNMIPPSEKYTAERGSSPRVWGT